MKDQTISIQLDLIRESGLDPEVWIHRYARQYREIVDQLIQEGQVLDKEFIELMLFCQMQDLISYHQ